MQSFIFGGDTGETAKSIARKRRIAQQLMAANSRAPRDVGEGLTAIGRALQARVLGNRADEAEEKGRAEWDEAFGSRFGQMDTEAGTQPAYNMSHIVDALNHDFAPDSFKSIAPLLAQQLKPAGPRSGVLGQYDEAVKQGFDGTLLDYQTQLANARRPSTRVNVTNTSGQPRIGTIPQGYQVVYDPVAQSYNMQPVPGGPAAREVAKEDEAKANRDKSKTETANLQLEEIGRAKALIEKSPTLTTGFFGDILRNVGGTGARDLQSLMDTIKANIGFDELNQMRAQSPTGGALGQVTERELAFLQAVAGSLDQAQSAEQLVQNLERLEREMGKVVHGPDWKPQGGGKTRRRYNPETGAFE